METKILWLKISYWTGAIADFIVGFALLFSPKLTKLLWLLETPTEGVGLLWAKYAGSMIFAWTCLLLWGVQKPIERKGILVLTVVPVIVSLIGSEVYALANNVIPSPGLWLFIAMQIALMILFSYGLYNVRNYTADEK